MTRRMSEDHVWKAMSQDVVVTDLRFVSQGWSKCKDLKTSWRKACGKVSEVVDIAVIAKNGPRILS
jgi:hypothetical protein